MEKSGLKEWLLDAVRMLIGIFGDHGRVVSVAIIALLLAAGAYVMTRGGSQAPRSNNSAPSAAPQAPGGAENGGATGDSSGDTGGEVSDGTGGHDEQAATHVSQSWTPTYVKVDGWEVAQAREDVLNEDWRPAAGDAGEGKTWIVVDLFVVNGGEEPQKLTTSCFRLVDGSGTAYPMKAFEPDPKAQEVEARPGSPASLEGSFGVPVGTQGLTLQFAPPGSSEVAEIQLPEVTYPIAQP